ncbi:phage tail tube protein [Oryzifoliimicrobium ureilyticus]|uniref:phage tail tube protein n=1 Tax=Oryzifoliimicrobium ureilyticus TaxID=3113724 RepID=UPI00307601AD
MTKRFVSNLAILAKIEATYGTDAVPTAALNAMQMVNATIEPLLGNDLSRDLVLPYMGNQGIILDGNYARISGEVELAGSGAAGTAPAFGPLLRCCGMREVLTAGSMAEYSPISKAFESASMYFNDDGVNHILVGTRGTFTIDLTPGKIPRMAYTLTGLIGTIADTPTPAGIDLTKFIAPVPVNKANTTFSLFGYSGPTEGITLDVANQIEPRMLINNESIEQTGRKMTGSVIMEAGLLADKNWLQIARQTQKGAFAAQQGNVAGNIVKLDIPNAQIGRPTQGASNGIRNYTLPIMATPLAGNDEFKLTFK